jgi:signal transduction histidine kinase
VHEAQEYARREGQETALASFNDPNGSFVRGDLYIFAYDDEGTTLALPLQPGLVGTSRWDTQDPDGVFFIRELALAARNGSGFVRYRYVNPGQHSQIQEKLSYVVPVDDTWWLGSGIYQED